MTNLLHTNYRALARDLLSQLTEENLSSLVKTVSSGRIQPVNKEETYNAVLLCCTDVPQLLSHRKITSHVLRQYLCSRGVLFNGHTTRMQLCTALILHWEQELSSRGQLSPNSTIKKEDNQSENERVSVQQEGDHNKFEPDVHPEESTKRQMPSPLNYNFSNSQTISNVRFQDPQPSSTTLNRANLPSAPAVAAVATNSHTTVVRVMSDEFSQDFCEWFYTMINRLQPECASTPGDSLRPEVFCSNCKVEMYLDSGEGTLEECKAESAEPCESIIRQLLQRLKLLFAPNLDGGIMASKSSHGLIQLFCCGTLHQGSAFLGIFEQEFGLVSSPIDKSWKIAYTKVNLKKRDSVQTPSLPTSEVFAIEY